MFVMRWKTSLKQVRVDSQQLLVYHVFQRLQSIRLLRRANCLGAACCNPAKRVNVNFNGKFSGLKGILKFLPIEICGPITFRVSSLETPIKTTAISAARLCFYLTGRPIFPPFW